MSETLEELLERKALLEVYGSAKELYDVIIKIKELRGEQDE